LTVVGYSSILLHIGTAGGKVVTLKVLPDGAGRYSVQPAGVFAVEDRVIRICPMHIETGHPAFATQAAVAGLRNGTRVNGTLLVVTRSGARIFKPPTGKGASKSWDKVICQAAGVSHCEDKGYALVVLNSDGFACAYSIPALREIASVRMAKYIDPVRYNDAIVSPSGDILGWTGPAEAALINVFGKGLVL
jgi:syntaxin-binding protein 5